MRTISEAAEDIKSILNNVERTEECTGETLVDINELVDEILTINCFSNNTTEIRNKAIDEFLKAEDYLMCKIKEETADVNIDFEWRKVVCLDDIRRMLHQGLYEIAEQMKGGE